MVSSAAHIPGHADSHVARLKEEAYAIRHNEDLFYPFAIEILGRFTWPWTGYLSPWRPFAWSSGRTPWSRWLRPFLGSGCWWRCRGLRPS
ncbi:unnamed protein product [Calypogeia fissa]